MIFNIKAYSRGIESGSSLIENEAFKGVGIIANKINESILFSIERWLKETK